MSKAKDKMQLCAGGLSELYDKVVDNTGPEIYGMVMGLHQLAAEALEELVERVPMKAKELVDEALESIYQLSEGRCPLCGEADYPVCGEKKGYGEVKAEDAEEWRLDHTDNCPVTKLDQALAALDVCPERPYVIYQACNKVSTCFFESRDDAEEYAGNANAAAGIKIIETFVMPKSKADCPECGGDKESFLATNEQGFVVRAKTGEHYSVPCSCQAKPSGEFVKELRRVRLLFTNGVGEKPYYRCEDEEIRVFVADDQLFCTVYSPDFQGEYDEETAKAFCEIGEILAKAANEIEQLQSRISELEKMLSDALPHIECKNAFQSSLITAIGEYFEALKKRE